MEGVPAGGNRAPRADDLAAGAAAAEGSHYSQDLDSLVKTTIGLISERIFRNINPRMQTLSEREKEISTATGDEQKKLIDLYVMSASDRAKQEGIYDQKLNPKTTNQRSKMLRIVTFLEKMGKGLPPEIETAVRQNNDALIDKDPAAWSALNQTATKHYSDTIRKELGIPDAESKITKYVKDTQSTIEKLTEKNAALAREKTELTNENAALKTEKDQLTSEISKLQEQIEALKAAKKTAETQNAATKGKTNLAKENTKLKQMLQHTVAELSSIQESYPARPPEGTGATKAAIHKSELEAIGGYLDKFSDDAKKHSYQKRCEDLKTALTENGATEDIHEAIGALLQEVLIQHAISEVEKEK